MSSQEVLEFYVKENNVLKQHIKELIELNDAIPDLDDFDGLVERVTKLSGKIDSLKEHVTVDNR